MGRRGKRKLIVDKDKVTVYLFSKSSQLPQTFSNDYLMCRKSPTSR